MIGNASNRSHRFAVLGEKYDKIEICKANFYRNIPLKAEYITRARREYHFDKVKISHFAIGEIYHFNAVNA